MRVAIDARELTGKPTGVGRYLAQILTAWGELSGAAAHEYVLCSPEPIVVPGTLRASVMTSPGPMVITIHDVSFAAHPEWFSWREGLRRRWVTRLAARRAAKIITVSDFSKREIVRHLHVPAAKVDVIYSGLTTLPAPPTGTREPVVLYVGSLFNRRHIPELVEGFSQL